MIYIILDSLTGRCPILVKAKDEDEVAGRLRLKDTEKIVGRITDFEVKVLDSSSFTVVTA